MSDRELLGLAAKAAGIEVRWFEAWESYFIHEPHRLPTSWKAWNPLTDDGDALRLAVRRRFHINIFPAHNFKGIEAPGFVEIWNWQDSDPIHTEYVKDADYEAATRRAITRAAAEIGRTL